MEWNLFPKLVRIICPNYWHKFTIRVLLCNTQYFYVIDSEMQHKNTQNELLCFHCKMVKWTRHNVTLYVHCLSFYLMKTAEQMCEFQRDSSFIFLVWYTLHQKVWAVQHSRYNDCTKCWTVRGSNPHKSWLVLGPTQRPVQWVPGLSRG